MKPIVYSVGPMESESIDYLNDHGINIIVGPKSIDYNNFKELGNDIVGLIFPSIPFPVDLLDLFPNLQLIARCGVGTDNLPIEEITKRGIQVTNTSGVNANSVAELTVGLMLALSHKIVLANDLSREGVDTLYQNIFTGFELKDKTVGLIGYGHIAKRVEELLNAFGVDILVTDHRQKDIKFGCQVPLKTLLTHSDIISLHMPLNNDTRFTINNEAFQLMNSKTLLINTARGGLIDEKDLLYALENNFIGGAALDTMQNEPISANHPLLKMKNVIVTPHIGSQTVDTIDNTEQMVIKGIKQFFVDKKTLNPVN